MSTAAYTPVVEPPVYDNPYEASSSQPRNADDNLPDDFKYSTNVASCELPIRQYFLRKVYSLLGVQLLATFAVGFIIRTNQPLQQWCFNNMWLFWVSLVGSIGCMIGAYIKARSYPTNLLLLGGFTLFESYGVGLVCALTDTDVLMQAILLTLVIVAGLTAFAFQTSYDFTSLQGYVSMGLWVLIGWGFVFMFVPRSSTTELIYSGFGALIFSIYIVIDTQNIMNRYHPEDEVPATITLYLDILNLFLNILRILSNHNND